LTTGESETTKTREDFVFAPLQSFNAPAPHLLDLSRACQFGAAHLQHYTGCFPQVKSFAAPVRPAPCLTLQAA